MALHSAMLAGLKNFFVGDPGIVPVKERINDRFFHVWDQARIMGQQRPMEDYQPACGEFATYRIVAVEVNRTLAGDSGQRAPAVGVACYSKLPDDAEALFETFWGPFTQNKYTGLWQGINVRLAYWDHATYAEDWDRTLLMANVSCNLIVKYNP